MQELTGKVAVITGGGSGIGRALATAVAAEGMRVVVADIEADAAADTAGALCEQGAQAIAVPCDVSNVDQVVALRDATERAFGAVHLVCNNAGVGGTPARAWEVTPEAWDWTLGVNLHGVINGIRAFVPQLVEQNEGHVVNTASAAAFAAGSGLVPYCTSKHAVLGLSECLYHDLAATDVGVTVLCPGFVQTRIHESDRVAPPTVVAQLEGDEHAAAMKDLLGLFVESGVAPTSIADAVVRAVQTNTFCVFTHADLADAARARTEALLTGTAPTSMTG